MVFRTLSGVASVTVAAATMRPTTASVLVGSRHDKKKFFFVFFNLGIENKNSPSDCLFFLDI